VTPQRLGMFEDFTHRLLRWDRAEKQPQYLGCLVLSDPARAMCIVPLLDQSCPTLCIMWHLMCHLAWHGEDGHVVHVNTVGKRFDSRTAVSHKFYYQCLLILDRCLPLSGNRIPSQQPQNYYKLLLQGHHAEPDKDNNHYIQLSSEHKKNVLNIPLPPPEPPPIDDDDIVRLPIRPLPAPKAHPRGPSGRHPKAKPRAAAKTGAGAPLPLPSVAGGPVVEPVPPGGPPLPVPPGPAPGPAPGPPLPAPPSPSAPVPGGAPEPLDDDDRVQLGRRVRPRVGSRGPARGPEDLADWVVGIGGVEVRHEKEYIPPGHTEPYVNWQIRCRKPTCKKQCGRTRGVTARNMKRFGMIEPLAFLHAWHDIPWTPAWEAPTHRGCDPTPETVEAIVRNHQDELERLVGT